MSHFYSLLLFLILGLSITNAQTTYTWNGGTSSTWTTSTNWTPNGVPTSTDNIVITNAGTAPVLSSNYTVTNVSISTGTLDLGGFLLINTGTSTFNGGAINNGTVHFNSATSTTFAGTTFGAAITGTMTLVAFNGSTFNNSVTVSVNTNTVMSVGSGGGNTFNGPTSIINSGVGNVNISYTNPDVYNSTATFATTNTGGLTIGYSNAVTLNGNVTINNPSGTGYIQIGTGSSSITLGNGVTISTGTFSTATLYLQKVTQSAATSQTINPGSAGNVSFNNCTWGGNMSVTAQCVSTYSCTYNGTVTFTKVSTQDCASGGLNIFNNTLTINNSGAGYFLMRSDIYNGDVYTNNNGSSSINMCYQSTNTQFNGNVYISQTGSATYTNFGYGGFTPSFSVSATKSINTLTCTAGSIGIYEGRQLGAALNSFSLTGSGTIDLGANVFNGTVTVVSPNIATNLPNTFNAPTTITKTGGGPNLTGANTFNSTCTINQQSSSGYFMVGYGSAVTFNDNVDVNIPGASPVYFGYYPAGGGVLINNGKTISSSTGINNGGFVIYDLTHSGGGTAMNYSVTGTGYTIIGPGDVFSGAVNVTAPDIRPSGATYNGAVVFTKTGTTSNSNSGSINTFNSTYTFNQQGSGSFILGDGAVNVFNGDIILSSNSSGTGAVYLGYTGGGSGATLAATKNIQIGGSGYLAGAIRFNRFTQNGSAASTITTSSVVTIEYGSGSTFGGNVTSTSGSLLFNGTTFNGAVNCTKNGTSNDNSTGNNTFNGVSTITNSNSGYLLFGLSSNDVFNATSNFVNTGSGLIYLSYAANTTFAGNVRVNSTGSSPGIYFGEGGGSTTLNSGYTLAEGASTFSVGLLSLKNFTQLGSTTQSMNLTGTSTLRYGPNSVFNGNVTSTSGGLLFNGVTFAGTTNCTKTHNTADVMANTNVFTGASTITNNGTGGYLQFGSTSINTFSNTLTLNNTGSGDIYMSESNTGDTYNAITINNTPTASSNFVRFNGTSTTINGNVTLNQTQGYISFGASGASPVITQAASRNINTSAVSGGDIRLYNFYQTSPVTSTTSTLTSSGTSGTITFHGCRFYDHILSDYANAELRGSTFHNNFTYTKNNGASNNWYGGNTFNGAVSVTNNSANFIAIANTSGDDYNGNFTIAQSSTGAVYPSYATNCTYAGNITVNSSSVITFNASSGTSTLDGGLSVSINKSGSANPTFNRLTINKAAGDVTLNTRTNISGVLTLTQGLVNTTSSNILNMNNGSSTTIGTSTSYIVGPMNYDMALNGARTLNFPIGKGGDHRPAVLALTHNTGTSYTYKAEVINTSAHDLGWTYPSTISWVSKTRWWDIDRTVTGGAAAPSTDLSGNQTITLYYGANDYVTDPSNLTVAKNTTAAPTTWIDIGGTGATVTSGNVTSTSTPSVFTSFSRFTIANKYGGTNPLPIELLSFEAQKQDNEVSLTWATATEINNDRFEIEHSDNGINFNKIASVKAQNNGNSTNTQYYQATHNNPINGINYYRLKQIDQNNGPTSYTDIRTVVFTKEGTLSIYPNPAKDKVTIQLSKGNGLNGDVLIYNSIGKLIKQLQLNNTNETTISITDLAQGVYYLSIPNSTINKHVKFVVER